MDEGLRALEEKISQITQLNARLRDEAQTLRQQLAAANNEIARQQDKLETARTRITDMLARLPSEEV
jgi:predicted  nucleic acid-binding Zn-ribbon protein